MSAMGGKFIKNQKCACFRFPSKKLLQGFREGSFIAGHLLKQCHAGAKFQGIGITEYLLRREMSMAIDCFGTLNKSWTQYWMIQIGDCLVLALDSIEFSSSTSPQPLNLWKDVPHPVREFFAVGKLAQNSVDVIALGRKETLKVMGIGHIGVFGYGRWNVVVTTIASLQDTVSDLA